MDELVRNNALRARATWYLLPVVDAHGYKRTWAGERFLRTSENGENPNLNFPFRWGEAPPLLRRLLGKRLRKWMGPHPASADCVKSLVAELSSLNNLQLFLDFHGFGSLWLYPWCYSSSPSPHHTEHKAASAAAVAAANRVAGSSGYRAQAAAHTEVAMGGSCLDFIYGELGCTHSYAVELPPSLPWGGVLGATLLGALRGDPKGWWRKGQDPGVEVAIAAGNEMAAALSALVDHALGGPPASAGGRTKLVSFKRIRIPRLKWKTKNNARDPQNFVFFQKSRYARIAHQKIRVVINPKPSHLTGRPGDCFVAI